MQINLKPQNHTVYPPFKNGKYMEEYFDEYWQKQLFAEKSKLVYLDIYWLNVFFAAEMDPTRVIPHISNYIIDICKIAEKENKIVFTICQWDDGICMGHTKPHNLIVFSVGQSIDIPLPLIVEDKNQTLRNLSRNYISERTILASFVGTCTHNVRNKMVDALINKPGFEIIVNKNWNINVPANMVNIFINTTKKSRFGLAPRGYGASSFRFFEIMEMGIIPVYIHDGDNALPFRDILDYNKFSISTHIDDINTLSDILRNIDDVKYNEMIEEMKRVSYWFTMEGTCDYIKQSLIKLCI